MTLPIDETREDIVNRLSSLAEAGILVRGLSNRQGALMSDRNGVVTVVKISDSFGNPTGGQNYRQDRQMLWLVDVALEQFVGQSGAQTITEAIASLLIGFQPRHCKKMYLQSIEYMPGKDTAGRWIHEIKAIAPSLLVELPERNAQPAPLLLRVVHEVISANGNAIEVIRATDDPDAPTAVTPIVSVVASLSGSKDDWAIALTFDAVPDAVSYSVQVSANGDGYVNVSPSSTSGSGTLIYTFSGLADGNYQYRVRVNYADESSAWVESDRVYAQLWPTLMLGVAF